MHRPQQTQPAAGPSDRAAQRPADRGIAVGELLEQARRAAPQVAVADDTGLVERPGADAEAGGLVAGMGTPEVAAKEQGLIMARGTVKWFNPDKGYGFIDPDHGEEEIFVHYSGIQGHGYRSLEAG